MEEKGSLLALLRRFYCSTLVAREFFCVIRFLRLMSTCPCYYCCLLVATVPGTVVVKNTTATTGKVDYCTTYSYQSSRFYPITSTCYLYSFSRCYWYSAQLERRQRRCKKVCFVLLQLQYYLVVVCSHQHCPIESFINKSEKTTEALLLLEPMTASFLANGTSTSTTNSTVLPNYHYYWFEVPGSIRYHLVQTMTRHLNNEILPGMVVDYGTLESTTVQYVVLRQ